ncbi:uncharacterized protein LOC126948532 [Macaca thibetana thibetana]|uniref:uncharacterized protein LOC126948532 n=1 Tax=Macaca thibetana thibetana TaxID=257877 RepID=UPI0021BCC022|nr:uncharacterized protein LOC126948532 [Macaca thibetana thibetana]
MWNPPATAGAQHESPGLGCGRRSLEAPGRSHGSMTTSVFPPSQGLASWEVSVPCPHPLASPDKATWLPTPASGKRRAWRAPPGAGPRYPSLAVPAVCGAAVPPARGRHPTSRSSSAGTRPPRRCRKEALRRGFLHTHVPLVCAPPACRCYKAGAAWISGRPHPPRPLRLAACIQSPWRLRCSIQDQAPPLLAVLPNTPEGRCREASPPARVPYSPFLLEGGVQALHQGCSATAHDLL